MLSTMTYEVTPIQLKRAFFYHAKQNEKMTDTMAYQRLLKYQLVSHYLKSVSHENSKCLDYAIVKVKHSSNRPVFLSYQTECENESYLTQ